MANSIVSAFRRRYPDDPRSDDELTLSIGQAYPQYSDPAKFPDFHSDLLRLTKATQPQPGASTVPPEISLPPIPPTLGDYGRQAVGSAIRSFSGTLGSIPEAVGSLSRIAGTYSVPEAEYVPMRFETEPGGLETFITRAGQSIAPEPVPGLEKSFLATEVPGGIASSAAFIVGGGVAGAAEVGLVRAIGAGAMRRAIAAGTAEAEALTIGKAAANLAARRLAYGNIASLGALSQAQSGYDEARRAGADEHTRFLAFALNLPVGMTEAVPLANMLNRLDKISGGTLKQSLVQVGVDSLEEAIQNAFQGVAGDVIASRIAKYEPDRQLFDSVVRDAASGGISAAVLSLATSALGGKLRRGPGESVERPASPGATGTAQTPPPPPPGAGPAGAAAAVPPGTTPPAAPAAAAPEVAAQYKTPEQLAAEHAAQMQAVARRSVFGGFEHEDISFVASLPPNEQVTYQGLVNQAREEKNAAETRAQQQSDQIERERIDAQLRQEAEDRQRAAEEQKAREASSGGGGTTTVGTVPVVTTPVVPVITPTSDAAPGTADQPVTAPEKGVVDTPAALVIPPSDLPPALEAIALKVADPKAGRLTADEQAALPAWSTDPNYAAFHKRVEELREIFTGKKTLREPTTTTAPAPTTAPTPTTRPALPSPVRTKATTAPQGTQDELLPFFDLLKQSDAELATLGQTGTLGPEPPAGKTHAEAAVQSVVRGDRVIGYVHNGVTYGDRQALALAKKSGLVTEKGKDKFGKGLTYFFKPENADEARRRMRLLNYARNTPELAPAWEYLHGAILGYTPQDIAFYLTRHPDKNIANRALTGARSVLAKIQGTAPKQGLVQRARAKATAIATTIKRKVAAVVHASPILDLIDFAGDSPLTFELSGRGTGTRSKLAAIDKDLALVSAGEFQGYKGKLIEEGDDAAGVLYEIQLTNGDVIKVKGSEFDLLVDIRKSMQKGSQTQGRKTVLAPTYFEFRDAPEANDKALEDAGLVSRASITTDPEHGSRLSWTHRWTIFRTGNRIFFLPTYKGEGGAIMAAEAGKNKGTRVVDLMKKGYRPIASFRAEQAAHAFEIAKPVMGADEYERTFAVHARDRMAALARTASAFAASMQPGQTTSIESVIGTSPRTVSEVPGAEEEIAGAGGTVEAEIPMETVFSVKLAEDLYDGLTKALAQSPQKKLSVKDEKTLEVLTKYASKGKYGKEIRDEIIRLGSVVGLNDAADHVFDVILGSYNNTRSSKGFADAVSGHGRSGSAAAAGGVGGLRVPSGTDTERRRSQPAAALPAAPTNAGVAGQPAAESGPTLSQSWARSQPKFTVRSNGYNSENIVRSLMQQTLERLSAAGIDVTVFQRRLDGLLGEFHNQSGGVQIDNAIYLVFNDITKPTLEDFVTVLHEAVHVLAAKESPEMQRRIHRAIDKLSDVQLGLIGAGDVRASQANPAGLGPEELANERLAEALANEGLFVISARSWSQKIIRFLKDLYNRACMAIQETLFGPDAVNPERVVEYYRNRLRALMAGDPMPLSFVDLLGGQRLHLERRIRFFMPVHGDPIFWPVVLDESGRVWLPDDSTATVSAAVQDIRNVVRTANTLFRKPTYTSEGEPIGGENPTVRGSIEFAANNGMLSDLTRAYDAFNASGANPPDTAGARAVTFDTFIGMFQRELDHPQAILEGIQAELNAIGAAQVNPDLRTAGPVTLESDALTKQSQAIHLSHVNQWLGNLNAIFTSAIRRREIIGRALARTIDRAEKLAAKYQNLAFHFEAAKEAISDLIAQTKEDIREGIGLAKHAGMLTQALRELQARVDDPLPTQYRNLIDRMARRIFNDVEHFTGFLQEVANMDVDWHGQTLPQIKNQLRTLLAANPLFSSMDVDEQNVALALTAAFARSNDHQMAWLAVRQSNDMEAVDAIREMLNEARKDTTAGLNAARGLVNRVPRLARQAQRILDHYLNARKETRSWLDEQVRNVRLIQAHDVAAPILGQSQRTLETALGASRPVSLVEGAKLPYVTGPTDTPEEIAARDPWEYHATGTYAATPAQVGTQVRNYRAWVEANRATGGAMVNTLEDLANRLELLDAGKQAVGIRQGLLARAMGSLSDACFQSGSVIAQRIGKALTRYSFLEGSFLKELSTIGVRVASTRAKAMNALGIKNSAYFMDTFHDGAFGYFEKRKDLLERPDAHAAALAAWHSALLANTTTRAMVTAEAWERLKTYYETCVEYNRAQVRIAGQMGIKISDKTLGLFRDPIGDPLFTMPRGLNTRLELMFEDMRDEWNGVKSPRLKADDVAKQFLEDPAALQTALRDRFTPEVWRLFVGEMAGREGRSMFSGRQWAAGKWTIASTVNTRRAYAEAGGDDALGFAVRLHELEGGSTATLPAFVGETLETFQNYFDAIEAIMAESENAEKRFGLQKGVPRFLMDARVSEDFPTGWLRYQHLDEYHAKQAIHRFAFHSSFGRNGETVSKDFEDSQRELKSAAIEWEEYLRRARNEHPLRSRKEVLEAARTLAKAEGKNLSLLENAGQNVSVMGKTQRQMEAWFRSHSVDSVEPRVFLEMLSFLTSMMVQGPKTAIINTMDLFGGPVIQYGLNAQSLRQVRDNWTNFFGSAFGSLFQTFGIQINANMEDRLKMRELGLTDPDNAIKLMDRFTSAVNSETFGSGRISGGFIRGGRLARAVLQAGLPARTEGEGLYPTMKLAPFSMVSRWMNEAFILGNWGRFRGFVGRAIDYLRAHPEVMTDDSFRFTPAMMGFPKGTFFDDAASFEAIKEAMNRWGMSLENVAKAAMRPGAPMFTDDQFRALAEMALEEMSLESSPNTAPRWGANPVGRATMPLLRWSFARTNQLRKAFQEPSGPKNLHSVLSGMKTLALAAGVGISYALLMEKYDEEITGKKSNIRGFGQDNNFLAAVEMTARMGSLGIWGDVANTLGNYAGTGDLRGMSLDNRVVFVNSLINTLAAITTFAKQGEATYATVYRQLVLSLGGSGYLQIAQILNNMLSLDNAETRVTSRINVNNWLRAVGREMDLDVRTGRAAGVYANTNTIKPWVGEMLLAALADNQEDFIVAYSKAVSAAREEGKPDPAKHVQQSYAAYNPLRTVFTTPPTEAEFAQLLQRLPASGRADVQAAILLFNKYGGEIGVNEYEGRVEKPVKPPPLFPRSGQAELRRNVAANLFPAMR